MMEESRTEPLGLASRPLFEQAFMPHLDAAYNLARWLMRNDQDAEDSVQEAYLRAYKAFPSFRGGDGKTWLMTIVRNVCFSAMRKLKAQETPESFDEEIHRPDEIIGSGDSFHKRANAETLQVALEKLAPEFREMIVLHDLEGLSYREIAAAAGIPIGTVMSRLARAREKLRAAVTALDPTGVDHEL